MIKKKSNFKQRKMLNNKSSLDYNLKSIYNCFTLNCFLSLNKNTHKNMKYFSRLRNLFLVLFIVLAFNCSSSSDDDIMMAASTESLNNSETENKVDNGYVNADDSLEDITRDFKTLMNTYKIDGAQLAITRNEKLVYLTSFGLANKENGVRTNEGTRFRIASVSKAITLLALSKLVSENKISLDDTVFGPTGLLGTDFGSTPYENDETLITVLHLIEHKAGFTNDPYDIMFDAIGLTQEDLISKVLNERSLAYEPGSTYEYSNFGYCILGRIIEKVTGKSYENYVQTEVLYAMDITQMEIADNTLSMAAANEATYYSNWASPYNMNVNRMDSHGGWIASAKDLISIAVQLDLKNNIPDFMPKENLVGYLNKGNWNQNGVLPGSIAVLQVGPTFSFAVLINNSELNYYETIQVLRSFVNKKIKERDNWPSRDLFNFR